MNSFQRWVAQFGKPEPDPRLTVIPCGLTVIGLALSLAWLARLVPWWTGVLGLLLDCVDGAVARRLRVESNYGSLLDWTVDIVLFAGAIAHVLPPEYAMIALCAAIPMQVWLRVGEVRFCGRALLFLYLLGREAYGAFQ